MSSRPLVYLSLAALWFGAVVPELFAQSSSINVDVTLKAGSAPAGFVEIAGVEAGEFDPAFLQPKNFLPDQRHPFLNPLAGTYRNIYAPSVTETPTGYRFFYGAWDGLPHPPKDRIYAGTTDFEFLSVQDRKSIVLPGTFGHVCNVNALRFDDGSYRMFGTVEFTANPHKNRPAFFSSDTTGTNWNGTIGEPYTAKAADFITISGYTNDLGGDKFPASDINGINVMVHEDGVYRLYFADFQDAPNAGGAGFKVYRATSENGKNYTYDGVALNQGNSLANDVKKFRRNGVDSYLMGIHFNGWGVWQSLSTNGASFPTSSLLFTNLNTADRYIVAMGWVVRGKENEEGRKLLGILYGAGATASLDQNRIFARWVQKRTVFVADDGTRHTNNLAYGPNRGLVQFPTTNLYSGYLEVYNETGTTLLGKSLPFTTRNGQRLEIKIIPLDIVAQRSTGTDANGALLAGGVVDPHFQLIQSADPSYPGPNAVVVEPLPSQFGPNGPNSKWIAPRMNATNSPGIYIYRTTLPILGVDPRIVTLEGRFLYDNILTNITVNGVSNRFANVTALTTWRTLTITNGLKEGTNVIDIMIRNGGTTIANRTGLRVELTAYAPAATSFTAPTVTSNPQNFSGKHGTNILLTTAAIGSLPFDFQWEHNGTPLAGETNSALAITDAQPAQSGDYRARIKNAGGEVYTTTALIQIAPPTPPAFQNYSINSGQFGFSVSGDSGDRYILETSTNLVQWLFVRNLTNVNGTISVAEPVEADGNHYYRLQIAP
ncbi:MAG: hypothetical protein H0X66_13165 [Verrucomicrobia bacterium]|nr:hypothetical protein [Verrucomicrobiota bacterium]